MIPPSPFGTLPGNQQIIDYYQNIAHSAQPQNTFTQFGAPTLNFLQKQNRQVSNSPIADQKNELKSREYSCDFFESQSNSISRSIYF